MFLVNQTPTKVLKEVRDKNIQQKSNDDETLDNKCDIVATHILGHHNTKKSVRYELKYSDGTEEYANESDAKLDCKKLINEYTKKIQMSLKKKPPTSRKPKKSYCY